MRRNLIVTVILLLGLSLSSINVTRGRAASPLGGSATSYAPAQTGPTLFINDVSLVEGNAGTSNMVFTVTLTATGARPTIGVGYETANGAPPSGATAPSDYTAVSNFLIFPSGTGSTTMTISVPIVGDTSVEPNETFFVNLGPADGATIIDGQGVGTIINDEGAPRPTLSIADTSLVEGNAGTSNMVFSVSLTATGARPSVTVHFATADGVPPAGASSSSDYAGTSGDLVFQAGTGNATMTILVPVNGDTSLEPDEIFFVNLNNPTGGDIADVQAVGTIINDEGNGECSFSIACGNTSICLGSSFGPAGVTDTVQLITQEGCRWTAISNASWITILSGDESGVGSKAVSYTVAPNSASGNSGPRRGTMTIGGLTFEVFQYGLGECQYSITPSVSSFPDIGGTGTVTVTNNGNCGWMAASEEAWITILSTTEETGTRTGTVTYSVSANPGFFRQGFLSIADQKFLVRQETLAGCSRSTSPELQPRGEEFLARGGSSYFKVLAGRACNWMATVNVDWIQVRSVHPPEPGGETFVDYVLNSNPNTTPRRGTVSIRASGTADSGPSAVSFVVTQGGLSPSSCVEAISPLSANITNAADEATVFVTAPPDCTWEPIAQAPWINIENANSDNGSEVLKGNGQFTYRSFQNPGSWRAGVISVGGKRHDVYQNSRDGDCFIELLCKFFPGTCQSTSDDEARSFRDKVLAQTPRGQRYTQLYYKFSTEAIGLIMLNPSLILRSREILERYRPVLNSMTKGEHVTLTQGDIDEIESFLSSFAQKGSPGLQETLKNLSDDLHDPQVQTEFNITITDGPKREVPEQGVVQTIKQTGMMIVPLGLLLLCSYGARLRRNKQSQR